MMQDQVYIRALTLTGETDASRQEVLRLLCEAVFSALEGELRDGMAPEDCREVFVSAAAFRAAAALEELADVTEFKAGDLTVRRPAQSGRAVTLRHQAELLMGPYRKDRFLFTGV